MNFVRSIVKKKNFTSNKGIFSRLGLASEKTKEVLRSESFERVNCSRSEQERKLF